MGQIKNIKLHIVTDIKEAFINSTKTKHKMSAAVAVSPLIRAAKWVALGVGVYYGNVKFYEKKEEAREDLKSISFHIKDIKRKQAEKKAWEEAQPSIFEEPAK